MHHASILALFLTLSILAGLPTTDIPRVYGTFQTGSTTWSPFGPRTSSLTIRVYGALFDAFISGQVDLPDQPFQQPYFPDICSNPDIFCTQVEADFGIRQIDINHHVPFLGVALEEPRIVGTPTLAVTETLAGCSSGRGRLEVVLENLEEGGSVILDPLNKLQWSGPQNGEITDDPAGGGNVDGTYVVPTLSGCMLAGSYTISTTVYSGSDIVTVGSGQIVRARFSVNLNSASAFKLTQVGIDVRQALAHLLDKPNFVGQEFSPGSADYDDLQASPSQGLRVNGASPSKLPQFILDEDCGTHPWFNPGNCHPISAYNLADDLIGPSQQWWTSLGSTLGVNAGYSGAADLRAACDHLVAAGFMVTPIAATCLDVVDAASGTTPPTEYPHLDNNGQSVVFYIRSEPSRRHLGQVVFDSLNFLFGTPNNRFGGTVQYGCNPFLTILCTFDRVFDTTEIDDWNLYTGAWSLGAVPDQFYRLYHSSFASDVCGGASTPSFANNYPFYCNPALDTNALAGEFAESRIESDSFLANAALIGHRTVMTIPLFTLRGGWQALNGWNFQATSVPTQSSLVKPIGRGFEAGGEGAYWSLLNMHQVPGYSPQDPSLRPGGGDPNLIRRGWSQEAHNLSPFLFLTSHDFEIINLLYDSMLQANPLTTGTSQQAIDWMTTKHTSSFNPAEISCADTGPVPLCTTGTTTQLWTLRIDLKWHDGAQITADDVVYSLKTYDSLGIVALPPPALLQSVEAVNPMTIRVKIPGQSPYYETAIGLVPIIPKHIWAPLCGDPFDFASQCGDPTFDPMAGGALVGEGPWICRDITTGHVGGSCVRNPDGTRGGQDIVAGAEITLSASNDYFRGRPGLRNSGLHKFSWADGNNDGVVNILDLANVALRFGGPDPYWNTGQNPNAPDVGVNAESVDIGELATVAFYFDIGLTLPFITPDVVFLDPQIDPFFCLPAGC